MSNQIKPTGTDEQLVEKYNTATLAIDARAAEIKADADRFKAMAQDARKKSFPDQAVEYEASEAKLICKWGGLEEALRIIKQNVEAV